MSAPPPASITSIVSNAPSLQEHIEPAVVIVNNETAMTGLQLAQQTCKQLYNTDKPSDALVARFDRLLAEFYRCFSTAALEFVARAPGRVNIIGEHIDYCGGSVLPMCVENDVLCVGRRNANSVLQLANTNPKYGQKMVALKKDTPVEVDKSNHHWSNYFLCGYKAVVDITKPEIPLGMDVCLDGTVPAGAGLSSSSALVCCAALATITAQTNDLQRTFVFFNEDITAEKYPKNRDQLRRKRLAEVCQHAERFVGTESGGMDQAISMLGELGFAARIDFNPLEVTRVRLPHGASWVVTNCLVEAHKVLSAATMYNCRVIECRLASILLAKALGVTDWANAFPLLKLCDIANQTRQQLHESAQRLLPAEPVSEAQIAALLDMPDIRSLVSDFKSAPAVFAENAAFALKSRALHVFSEADRVFQFEKICKQSAYPEQWSDLGALMSQSHQSCSELYNCSCEALDELQAACISGGAFGSRLTGAGWGGCAISLVANSKLAAFTQHVKREYYDKLTAKYGIALPEKETDFMFVTSPACGARAMPLGKLTDMVDTSTQRTSASTCTLS